MSRTSYSAMADERRASSVTATLGGGRARPLERHADTQSHTHSRTHSRKLWTISLRAYLAVLSLSLSAHMHGRFRPRRSLVLRTAHRSIPRSILHTPPHPVQGPGLSFPGRRRSDRVRAHVLQVVEPALQSEVVGRLEVDLGGWEIWGDIGRCREIWGDIRRYRSPGSRSRWCSA